MQLKDRKTFALEVGVTTLKVRESMQQYLDEAQRAGNAKEAHAWLSQLHKIDKTIMQYCLEKYARERRA
jgi:hypothetical protein